MHANKFAKCQHNACSAVPRRVIRFLQTLQKPARNVALEGPLAPARRELFSEHLSVTGSVPQELDGLFIRTGSNPHRMPAGNYHWCARCYASSVSALLPARA